MNKDQAQKQHTSVKQTKKTMKHWVAVVLFGAIIIVFALWGVNPSRFGDNAGGFAATVNDRAISLAEYRSRVENIQANARMRFDQFPEAQRNALNAEIRRRALDDLIASEVRYQAARSRGIDASDAEVRDYVLQISFLQEKGRFMKDRYRAFLQNMGLSTEDFERQVRKDIVSQKLQELFVGSALPTRTELKHNGDLSSQKVAIRYVEIGPDDLQKPGFISDADVSEFLKDKKAEVEKYYKDNLVEFSQPEKVQARHILLRIDDKRPEAQALKMAQDLKKQATAQNFASLATKNSDDPGSKSKGGDLGEFEKGRMVPEFEAAAFSLNPGQISEPIKTPYGYHLIYVEKKTPAGAIPREKAEAQIARKLIVRTKESEVLAKTKGLLEKGDKKGLDALVQKSGLKWTDSGDFDLAAAGIPKLGESHEVFRALLKHGKAGGLIPDLVQIQGRHLIVDVLSWKQAPPLPDSPNSEKNLGLRASSDAIDLWSKEIEAKANVQKNLTLLQR